MTLSRVALLSTVRPCNTRLSVSEDLAAGSPGRAYPPSGSSCMDFSPSVGGIERNSAGTPYPANDERLRKDRHLPASKFRQYSREWPRDGDAFYGVLLGHF